MDRVADYLCIPRDYGQWLGGLRWDESGEAVEYEGGEVFAFRQQVALFLEGFATAGRLVHFAHVLHLLHLLGHGEGDLSRDAWLLCRAFVEAARPLRNAGVLCALLCRRVPPFPEMVAAEELCLRLNNSFAMWQMCSPAALRDHRPRPEVPALVPEVFEAVVLESLQPFGLDDLVQWFRHGRGPLGDAGDKVARELAAKPPSLADVLAAVAQRERLAGAVPHVAQFVSALTLPPRRLAHHELPVGGYADVATRGHPEQILPSQFALDDIEFLRRFAQRELLYFRREEPHAQTREELVLLLDQGVRTWGDVRLLLAAAVFAFAKLAARRGIAFKVAATSGGGEQVDPLAAGERAVADLLEASDLSPNPGLAVERVLEEPTPARDVVLLTHPRNLLEPDVTAAARRVQPGTRLFALAADGTGHVQLVELRHGVPVKLTQFRVDLSSRPSLPPRAEPAAAGAWSGAVEPVSFPFRFGVSGAPHYFDFDAAGEWLMTVSDHGMLHLFKVDGSHAEVVPRAMVSGAVLAEPRPVRGVAGGFVVCGRVGEGLVVLHYDLSRRTCTLHSLGSATREAVWYYFRELHVVVARSAEMCVGLDLATGECHPPLTPHPFKREVSTSGVLAAGASEPQFSDKGGRDASRAARACRLSQQEAPPSPFVSILSRERDTQPDARWVHLDSLTGRLSCGGLMPAWPSFTPLADGAPMLKGCRLMAARYRGGKLAVIAGRSTQPGSVAVHVFRGPEGLPVFEHRPLNHLPGGFALSADGRLLAHQTDTNRLAVHDLEQPKRLSLTLKGRWHNNVAVQLGGQWLLIQVGRFEHLVHWDGDELILENAVAPIRTFFRTSLAGSSRHVVAGPVQPGDLPSLIRHDPARFRMMARSRVLVVVDAYGQLAVFDLAGELICMLFAFRGEVAAWMPDGTRYGSASLMGGPPTPGALRKLAQALRAASHWGVTP
jgi:hypothetical protein